MTTLLFGLMLPQVLLQSGLSDAFAIIGVAFVLGQASAIATIFYFFKSFGAYTTRNERTIAQQEQWMKQQEQWTNALLYAKDSYDALTATTVKVLGRLEYFETQKGRDVA